MYAKGFLRFQPMTCILPEGYIYISELRRQCKSLLKFDEYIFPPLRAISSNVGLTVWLLYTIPDITEVRQMMRL